MNGRSRPRYLVAAIAALLAGAGCGGGGQGERAAPQSKRSLPSTTSFTVVARDLAWDVREVTVPVGQEVTVTVDNADDGVNHNLHVKVTGDPRTALEAGPVEQTLRFTAKAPGTYEFVCDIHPAMAGTITAE